MNIHEFIKAHGLSISATPIAANPNMPDFCGKHWNVIITCDGRTIRRMRIYFSQGTAHTEPPTAADVLNCLASDASTLEGAKDFELWAADLGYSTDSRAAERTFKVTRRQTASLERLLGRDAYLELLFDVEQL